MRSEMEREFEQRDPGKSTENLESPKYLRIYMDNDLFLPFVRSLMCKMRVELVTILLSCRLSLDYGISTHADNFISWAAHHRRFTGILRSNCTSFHGQFITIGSQRSNCTAQVLKLLVLYTTWTDRSGRFQGDIKLILIPSLLNESQIDTCQLDVNFMSI